MARIAAGFADGNGDDQRWRRVGDVLVEKSVITADQLRQARETQGAVGGNLGEVLIALGFAADYYVAMAVAKACGLQYFDFRKHKIDYDAVRLVPMSLLQRHGVLPVMLTDNGKLVVAVSDLDASRPALDEIRELLKERSQTPQPVLSLKTDLQDALNRVRLGEEIARVAVESASFAAQPKPDASPPRFSPTGKTRIACVWGHPVAHSRSPRMQNAALAALGLDWAYVAFDVPPDNLQEAVAGLRAMSFVGANCTVPLKEHVGQYLDVIDPAAERIGSVNTIVNRGGMLTGYSTDGPGLAWDLERQSMLPDAGGSVLVWGAGGSARAIAADLAARGLLVTIANRTESRAVDAARVTGPNAAGVGLDGAAYRAALETADLLVNATTLGMDGVSLPPLPPGLPRAGQAVYDIVYAPMETPLLARARAAGCRAVSDGAGMLACQGALSLALWSGLELARIPLDVMLRAAAEG